MWAILVLGKNEPRNNAFWEHRSTAVDSRGRAVNHRPSDFGAPGLELVAYGSDQLSSEGRWGWDSWKTEPG